MKLTRRAAFVLALVLLLGCVPGLVSASSPDKDEHPKFGYNYTVSDRFEKGNIVLFGSYPQKGEESEPVEWIVASVEDGKAFLVSRYCLDAKKYNETHSLTVWEGCSLRKWLADEFLPAAFTAEEQARLNEMKTGDKVTVPSFREMCLLELQLRYGFPTAYAENAGAYDRGNGACRYWLRDMGISERFALYMDVFGMPFESGVYTDTEYIAVRPAILVSVED